MDKIPDKKLIPTKIKQPDHTVQCYFLYNNRNTNIPYNWPAEF